MIYKVNNQADSVLNMDNDNIYQYIIVKYEAQEFDDKETLELMKEITRNAKKLHEIAVETKVPIYDILRIIVSEIPELVDKRFLTRMRKLYNTAS